MQGLRWSCIPNMVSTSLSTTEAIMPLMGGFTVHLLRLLTIAATIPS